MNKPEYLRWIIKEDGVIKDNSIQLKCYRIEYNNDPDVLDDWALHIRRHYIPDDELEEDCTLLGLTSEEYLRSSVIPQKDVHLGPTSRSNTITEILISDLLEFVYGFHVPRIRQTNMSGTTVSEHGTDVIGYQFEKEDKTPSSKDKLIAAEVKAVLSKADTSVIKSAVEDSVKDEYRVAQTLNYMRKKLKHYGKLEESKDIERFQLKTKYDYSIFYVPAGITSLAELDEVTVGEEKIHIIPEIDGNDLKLCHGNCIFFVHGKNLMKLTHEVFERCTK